MEAMKDNQTVRIAIPVVNGRLSAHFGHCQFFALIDVDMQGKTVINSTQMPSPGHQPGALPLWLHQQGTNVIITGGMGGRAIDLFTQYGISVIMGASEDTPERIVQGYLEGLVVAGQNACEHGGVSHGSGNHDCKD
ncbi:MAG: NifB/NifX family molybdenum-iron cluster-binding protein [Candidatus Electryoneaceae bacterium]|nr:NifB/NifX family molybdenum-iron cluster-binding protein [Candidatus Electryoneaceae bacterium]